MIDSMIILLGNELCKYTNTDLKVSMGIIKLAIKDSIETEGILNLDSIDIALKKNLSERLRKLNVSNITEIIANLEKVAKNNQSLLIMEAI